MAAAFSRLKIVGPGHVVTIMVFTYNAWYISLTYHIGGYDNNHCLCCGCFLFGERFSAENNTFAGSQEPNHKAFCV